MLTEMGVPVALIDDTGVLAPDMAGRIALNPMGAATSTYLDRPEDMVFATDLVVGAWIHTRSVIRHHAPGPAGATVDVHATVVERFEQRGRRAVADVRIELDGQPLATLVHEAIVDLTGA